MVSILWLAPISLYKRNKNRAKHEYRINFYSENGEVEYGGMKEKKQTSF